MGLCVMESSGYMAGADARQKDMLENPENYGGYRGTGIKMTANCPNPRFGSGYYSDTDRGPSGWWYHGTCATCGAVFHAQGSSAEQTVKNACNSPHTYEASVAGTAVIFPVEE